MRTESKTLNIIVDYWKERIPKQKKRIISKLESLGATNTISKLKACRVATPCNNYILCPRCQINKQGEDILFIRRNLKKNLVRSISFISFNSRLSNLIDIPKDYNKILLMWKNLYTNEWFLRVTEGWFRSFLIEKIGSNWRICFNIGFVHNIGLLGLFNQEKFLIQKIYSILTQNEKNILTLKNYELNNYHRSDQIALLMNYTIPILWKDLVVNTTDDEFKFFLLHMKNYLTFNYSYGGIFSNTKWNDSVTDFLLDNKETSN